MAHYAVLNKDNVVTQVVVGKDDSEEVDGVKRTSYNTSGNTHSQGKIPFRKNYAGIGYTYDEVRDAFIPIKSYPSWVLDEDTCRWNAPVAYPDENKIYIWNEDDQAWDLDE